VIVLGIESATTVVGAAVTVDERLAATLSVVGERRHAETLAPAIARVLELVGLEPADLDAIAVDIGPGLFTGLRVGVATAKGLAQGLGVGVIGATSLEILAAGALGGGWPGEVTAIVDGRRGEVFVARFGRGAAGEPVELSPPARVRPEELAGAVGVPGVPTLVCGDGALRYRDLLQGTAGVAVAETPQAPDPAALVRLVIGRLSAGWPVLEAAQVAPVYLREADARINWAQRTMVGNG
jgi:tRNA threonylcarbamoyladenosine biosynthesis protein TsaB